MMYELLHPKTETMTEWLKDLPPSRPLPATGLTCMKWTVKHPHLNTHSSHLPTPAYMCSLITSRTGVQDIIANQLANHTRPSATGTLLRCSHDMPTPANLCALIASTTEHDIWVEGHYWRPARVTPTWVKQARTPLNHSHGIEHLNPHMHVRVCGSTLAQH